MSDYQQSARNKVKRVPDRGHYDKETVYAILDHTFVCHVSFSFEGQPFIIPTLYGREENKIFIHGATSSRMIKHLNQGAPISLAVTHVDGIVLARSAFHHSANYRSVVVFGTASQVADEKKEHALYVISEHVLKGRWNEVRAPNNKELKATTVMEIDIEQASAKIRRGGPSDDKPDYALDIWAGVIPVETVRKAPIADKSLRPGIPLSASVKNDLN